MINRAVAKRYARALLDEAGAKSGEYLAAIQTLDGEIRAHRHLEKLLYGSLFSVKQRTAVFAEIAAKLGLPGPVVNFGKILIESDRMRFLPAIIEEFQKSADEKAGVARARVESAAELPADVKAKLTAELQRIAGRKVDCTFALNPALIGGVSARIGDLVLDGSVSTQLRRLSRRVEQGA